MGCQAKRNIPQPRADQRDQVRLLRHIHSVWPQIQKALRILTPYPPWTRVTGVAGGISGNRGKSTCWILDTSLTLCLPSYMLDSTHGKQVSRTKQINLKVVYSAAFLRAISRVWRTSERIHPSPITRLWGCFIRGLCEWLSRHMNDILICTFLGMEPAPSQVAQNPKPIPSRWLIFPNTSKYSLINHCPSYRHIIYLYV